MYDFREKKTDVNIATQMWWHAVKGDCDVIILVTGDSDLCATVERLPEAVPQVRVVVAFPPARVSKELKAVAPNYINIDELMLHKSQLPDQIERIAKGKKYIVKRPDLWKP